MTNSITLLPGFERIRGRFLDILTERLEEIEGLSGNALRPMPSPEALGRIRDLLHNVAGTAGTVGFGELSESARTGETAINAFLASDGAAPRQVRQSLAAFFAAASVALSDGGA